MTDEKIDFTNLKCHWERSKVKRILAPVYEGVRMTAEIFESLTKLHPEQLTMALKVLWDDYVDIADEMLDKKTVAKIMKLTVSWLDNSHCEKARRFRAIGVRCGKSQTSPVRFQRSRVQEIARLDEGSAPDSI